MILYYLILSHFIGDFVLQPKKLVEWKMKSIFGTAVHALIHFFVLIIVLLPFLLNGYLWLVFTAFGIAFVHFWIDEAKINYDLHHDAKVRPFIIDQLLHLLTLLLTYFFISEINFVLPKKYTYELYYSDIRIILLISFLIFLSTTVEIYRYQKMLEKNKQAKLKLHTNNILNRIIVFALIYLIFVLVGFYKFL